MNGTQDQQSTLGKLRSTYINAGLLSESTDLAQFSSAPESVRQTLLEQGRAKGLISEATTDEVFMSAWGDTEQKKKDDTESVSEDGSLEPPVVEGFDNQAERARGLRSTARLNEDGTESTVLMASMEVDGKNVAIPTLFPKDPNNVTSNPEDWMELDAMEAYDTALERGEVFEFETADDANAFAEGSWKVDTPVDAQQPIPRTESDEFFDMALEGVTPEVIGRTDDDDTVMEMNNLFGQYGFSFETANVLGDAMTVTAKNGETLRVDLDPWRSKTEVAESEKLNNFLKQNRKESENLLKQEDDYQAAKLKFANEKQIDQRVNQLSSEMDGFQQFSRELGEVEAAFNEKYAGLDKYTEEYLRANPDEIEAYNAQAEAYNADFQGIQELRGQLQHRSQELLYANQEINRAAAEFVEVQGGIYTLPGLVKTALSRGTANTARGLANFALDVTAPSILIDMRSDEDYPSRFIQAYKDIGGTQDVPEEDFEEWYDGLPDDLRHDVDMKVFDDTRKLQKYGNDEEKGLGDAVYDGIMWATGEDQKIPYAYELAQQNWWGGSILGAIESVPAFVGLGKKLFTTGFKAASRVARMFGQVTDHIDQEFRNNPELQDVTEQDKLLLKVPLGATVAVLENIGFRNVMANKGFASYFLMKVLGKSSLGVGKRSFRETVALEVNNAMARGLLTLGNAGAAEFETGMAQEIADIGAKELWNAFSDNPDLDTPELNEMLGQVVNAGAQEAVGSFVLGTPAAVSAAFQKADYASLSDEQVAILEFLSDPGNRGATKPMIAAHLKNLVNQGKLTGKQAKEALDGYESTVQALDGIRDVEGMSSEQKKKALALEVRKQELERRMNSTAKPFQRALQSKIDDLVIQQEEIADAIQEQSTEEVPTRDETEAGPEVGGQVQEDEKKGLVGRMRDRLQQRRVRKSKEEYDKAMARVAELEEQGATEQEIEDARNKAARDRNNYLRTILTEEQDKQEVELDNERERLFKEYEAAQGTEQEAEAEAAWKESSDKQTAFFNSVEAGLTEEVAAEEEVTEEVAAEEEVAPTEDEVAVEEEAAELAAAFEAEGTPDRTETTEAGVDVQRQEGSDLTKKQQRVVDQANNVLTSLKSLIPDIKVIAHQTQLQYEAATGLRGRGTYISDTQGKTIHINLSRANSRTAFHEAFHAIFLEQIKNGDPDAQAKAKVLLTTISKALPPKSVLKNRIDSFLTQYDQQDISEEALAEVFSYIASGYRGLGPQVKAKIKAAIKNLIESVLGRKLGASWSEGDQAVLDAMEILAGKVERGEAITSEDVSGIEVTEEAAAEVKAETEVDAAIGRIQELRRKAVGQANDLFGDLFVLLEESGKGDGSLFSVAMRRLFKDVGDSKLRAIEKKIRDVKKAKKLSDTDKAERVAKLEREAEKEVTRLEQAREQAKPGIKEAMAKLEPFAEKKRKKAGLADIKKKQAAITKKLLKDKKDAKKVFEGAELKEYLAELQEEAEAKRAALRQEIAELRGEKKTEAPVEEEAAPVEEEKGVAETKETLAKERERLQSLKQKLAEAKRDLREFEAREANKKGRKERDNKKKAVADIESSIKDASKNIKELEAEVAKREAAPVEEAAPVVEEQPTVATIRTKVGVEAFGKLEAAVRSHLDYINTVNPFEEERTRGEKATISRRDNKVNKLADELGLTGTELAVVLNSVREARREEKRAEENRKAEQAELKAAAERAKKAAEAPVEKTVEAEPAVEEELMPELTKRQLAKLLKERPNLRLAYFRKDGSRLTQFTIGYSRSDGKYFFSDGGRAMRDSEYNMFSQALERFLYQHNKAKTGGTGAGFIGLYDTNMPSEGALAKFDFEMNNITEAEPTVEEAPTVEEEVDDAEVARLEEELRRAEEDLDFYNRDEPDNTKYPKYKSFKQAKEAINAGKDPRFVGLEDKPIFPAQGANENLDEKYIASTRIPYITGMETTMVFEDSARIALVSINGTYRATKSRDTTNVGQDLEDMVKGLKKELAEAKKAPVDDVAKRAAVEGVSVEELTKQETERERQRKDTLSREAKRELDGLKGKTDKASKAKRAELKEFMANLGTMSVEEALAKRQPKAREQRVSDVAKRTEGNLKAREQKASEFSGARVSELSREGILSHFTDKKFDKFLPEYFKTGYYVEGVYFTGSRLIGDHYISDREKASIAFVDTNDMTFADRNRLVKDSEVKAAAEALVSEGLVADVATAKQIVTGGKVSNTVAEMQGNLINGWESMMGDRVTQANRGKLVLPAFKAAFPEYQGIVNKQTDSGVIMDAAIWDYDAINENIVEPKGDRIKAREQRVSDVVERYDFRPNGSLRESSLAAELRRNLKRYGFGVKQFGTRMDDVHIVNPATGRKVDPKKLIAKDRADEKVEREEMAAVEQEVAEKRALEAEAEDLRSEGLKRYQEEFLDFPEGMIPPSTLSAREQRDSLNDEISDEDSTYSAVKFAKERGYSNAAILKFRPGAQQAIDAYEAKENRLKEQVKGVIVKATERIRADKDIQGLPTVKQRDAAALARLENDVIRYLQKSKFYQNASDVGREAMVRGVKKQLGINMKSAPSANRLLNGPLDKNGFSEQEKKGLRDQIRAMARSSKTTATAIAEARKQIAKDVAKLRKDGVLTTAQATALLNRMARTNPLNEASVNSFIEYANKVFMDADYAKKMNDLNKMRARALKYAEEKTGINVDVIDVIRTIAGINAEAIPEEVLEEYTEVMTQLSERKAVLDLENRVSLRNKLETIIDAIDQEINAKDELLAEFENFDAKVPAKEKVSIAKTIKAMIEAGVITEDEAKLLRKYQGELFPEPEGKDDAELQQERENEARFLRGVVEGLPELTHKFPTREENILLRQFNELIKTSGIEGLDNAELKNLLRVANNIENGFLPHMAEVLVEKIDAENKRVEVVKSVVNDKSGLARLIDRTGLTSLNRRGRKNPTRYIDQVWGDFKSTRLFDAVFKDLAVASASYRADLQVVEARMDKVQDALIKALGRNPNKVTRAKFLLGAYLMQKEFEANPNVKGVFSAIDLLDATIKQSQKVSTSTRYNDASVEVLKSIRDQIELRTADEIEAIIKKEQGGKQMLAVADEIRKINDELTPKAQYVAGVIRGVPFMPYSQYMHRVVLKGENEYGEDSDKPLSDVMNKNMMPSTRAKNLIKREAGEVPPVNFDPFASVNRGAKFVLTDYYMTKPVRTNKRLVNKLGDLEDLSARQREMVQLLMNASETLVKDMLVQAVNQDSLGSKVFNYIKRKGYQVTLGQVERAVAELGSNASYALWVDPGSFRVGQTYRNIYNNDGTDILRNVGSMQTTRLFPGGEGTRFESSGLDQMRAATSPGRAEIRNEAANKGRQIINQSFGRLERGSGAIADYLITKPDQMISRPLWFGSFAREFEARTGQKPDMKKIAENNGEYMDRYSQAIESATAKADDTSIKAGATDNLFLGMLNGTIRPDQNGARNMWTFVNSYMTRFLIFEYVTARTAVQAMVGNGMMRKRDGVRLMAGVTSRMFAYQFISGALRDTMSALLYGDDEEEKDLAERASESVIQGMATLVLGNTMGQVGRGAIAIPVELLNRNILGEDYGFGKRKMMPLIDINPEKQFDDRVLDGIARSFGPASPAVRATLLGGELAFEEIGMKKKRTDRARAEQEQMRFLIKAAGAAGVLPFANDINYHYQRYIYKDIDKKKSKVIRLR